MSEVSTMDYITYNDLEDACRGLQFEESLAGKSVSDVRALLYKQYSVIMGNIGGILHRRDMHITAILAAAIVIPMLSALYHLTKDAEVDNEEFRMLAAEIQVIISALSSLGSANNFTSYRNRKEAVEWARAQQNNMSDFEDLDDERVMKRGSGNSHKFTNLMSMGGKWILTKFPLLSFNNIIQYCGANEIEARMSKIGYFIEAPVHTFITETLPEKFGSVYTGFMSVKNFDTRVARVDPVNAINLLDEISYYHDCVKFDVKLDDRQSTILKAFFTH